MTAIIRNHANQTIADGVKRIGIGIITGAKFGFFIGGPICIEWIGNALSRPILGLPFRPPLPVYTSVLTGALAGGLANAALGDAHQVNTIAAAVSFASAAMACLAPEDPVFKTLTEYTEYLAIGSLGILAVIAIWNRFAPLQR